MQAVSATLILLYIVILNCSLNKIFNDFQIRNENTKNFKILLKATEKNHEILSKNQEKMLWILWQTVKDERKRNEYRCCKAVRFLIACEEGIWSAIRNVESKRVNRRLSRRNGTLISSQSRRIGVQRDMRYTRYELSAPLETRRVSGHEISVSQSAQTQSISMHISMHSVEDLWVRWCSWETNILVNEQSVVEAVESLLLWKTLNPAGRHSLRGSFKHDTILSDRSRDSIFCHLSFLELHKRFRVGRSYGIYTCFSMKSNKFHDR